MNDSEFDESEMSEISVVEEINCSSFAKHVEEQKKWFFEESIGFEQSFENGGVTNLKENVVVFPKSKCTPNQVFVTKGLHKSDNDDLTSIVQIHNDFSSENHFWSRTIDNSDETIGLSTNTSWRVKYRYMPGNLNAATDQQSVVDNVNYVTRKHYESNYEKGKSNMKKEKNKERKLRFKKRKEINFGHKRINH